MPYANPETRRQRHRNKAPLTPNSHACLQALAHAYDQPRHPSELNQHPWVLMSLTQRKLAKPAPNTPNQYLITLRGLNHARQHP